MASSDSKVDSPRFMAPLTLIASLLSQENLPRGRVPKCFKNLTRWWRNYPEETKTHQFCHNKTFLFLLSLQMIPVGLVSPPNEGTPWPGFCWAALPCNGMQMSNKEPTFAYIANLIITSAIWRGSSLDFGTSCSLFPTIVCVCVCVCVLDYKTNHKFPSLRGIFQCRWQDRIHKNQKWTQSQRSIDYCYSTINSEINDCYCVARV